MIALQRVPPFGRFENFKRIACVRGFQGGRKNRSFEIVNQKRGKIHIFDTCPTNAMKIDAETRFKQTSTMRWAKPGPRHELSRSPIVHDRTKLYAAMRQSRNADFFRPSTHAFSPRSWIPLLFYHRMELTGGLGSGEFSGHLGGVQSGAVGGRKSGAKGYSIIGK